MKAAALFLIAFLVGVTCNRPHQTVLIIPASTLEAIPDERLTIMDRELYI